MTALGTRMKWYEQRYTNQIMMPHLPVMARIDGRSFSKFTNGLGKPYDKRLIDLMVETTKFVVAESNARCGYTQSDEITLLWMTDNSNEEIFFGGKLLKMTSVIASLATGFFNKKLQEYLPEKADLMPIFDCRVWELPTQEEAVNCFFWREMDARRNSIMSAARKYYSHKTCLNKNSSQLQEMLFLKGINWNEYPSYFKRGTYVRKKEVVAAFSAKDLESLPPKHQARSNPDLKIKRTILSSDEIPPLSKIENRLEVIFYGADPILRSEK